MTNGIKIEWEEPGPADRCRLTVVHGPEHTVEYRDPTESDLTRALELLAPEVRGRVIGKWRTVDVRWAAMSVPAGDDGQVLGHDGWGYPKPSQPGAVYSWDEAVENKPKISTDDITAALWAMPGKERAVVLYPFWPAISEAAQRTHLADEKATAAMADAALARLLLNDCRRVLTMAERERDDAIAKLAAVRRAAE